MVTVTDVASMVKESVMDTKGDIRVLKRLCLIILLLEPMVVDSMKIKDMASIPQVMQEIKLLTHLVVKLLTLILLVVLWLKDVDQLLP